MTPTWGAMVPDNRSNVGGQRIVLLLCRSRTMLRIPRNGDLLGDFFFFLNCLDPFPWTKKASANWVASSELLGHRWIRRALTTRCVTEEVDDAGAEDIVGLRGGIGDTPVVPKSGGEVASALLGGEGVWLTLLAARRFDIKFDIMPKQGSTTA